MFAILNFKTMYYRTTQKTVVSNTHYWSYKFNNIYIEVFIHQIRELVDERSIGSKLFEFSQQPLPS